MIGRLVMPLRVHDGRLITAGTDALRPAVKSKTAMAEQQRAENVARLEDLAGPVR